MIKGIFTIDMKLPSLNEYINVCRTNKYKAAKYKEYIEANIAVFLTKMPTYEHPIKIHFHWIEGNKKRDLDNVCFAKKFILDAFSKYSGQELIELNKEAILSKSDIERLKRIEEEKRRIEEEKKRALEEKRRKVIANKQTIN